MKNNLSIIISVHNRQKSLPRIIPIIKSIISENIYVVDSSEQPFENNSLLKNVIYKYNKGLNFYENIYSALETINTEYVIHLNDDDFIVASAIEPLLNFLENNQDYVMAHGMFLKINEEDSRLVKYYGIESYVLQKNLERQYNHQVFEDRLAYMFKSFISPNHSIIKTQVLKKAYTFVLKHKEYFPIRYFDKIIGVFISLFGKHKTLDLLFQIRSTSRLIDAQSYPEELKRAVDFEAILKLIQRKDDPLIECIAKHLKADSEETHTKVEKVLKEYTYNFGESITMTRHKIEARNILDRIFGAPSKKDRLFHKMVDNSQKDLSVIIEAVTQFPL